MSAKQAQAGSGMVKKSTLIIGVVVSFCIGLYSGHLATSLSADPQAGISKQVVSQQAPNPETDPEFRRFEQAVKSNPQNADAWYDLAHWYSDAGMYKESIKAYESALVIRPNDPNIITDMGVTYRNMHEHEKALDLFRRASAQDQNHLQSRFNQGIVLFYDLDRTDEAIAVWAELVKKSPDYRAPNGQKLADWVKDYQKK